MTTAEVYLLDVNVLIALAWPQHIHHDRAHDWFDSGVSEWATTPITEAGFVRLSTNPNVVGRRVVMADALYMLAAIRSTPGHRFLADGASLAAPVIGLSRLVTSGQATDAHLTDLAASSGAVLATLDRGIEQIVSEQDRRFVFVLP